MDIFCGIGGLTHGLIKAGISVNAGIDSDDSCRFAYESNNDCDFINRDIKIVTPFEISALFPKEHLKILTGCAPCQTFSNHTQKNKNRQKDEKWQLISFFQKLIEVVKPEIISMENVPQIVKYNVFTDFVEALKKNDYSVFWTLVFCPDYGIPQTRIRMVLLASRLGDIKLIPKTHSKSRYKTVRDAIAKLNPINNGEIDKRDPMHRSPSLSPINIKRIRQSKPGGTWRDWNKSLRATCHQKTGGKTYVSVYSRMEWDKPAPTITTQFYGFGTGRFGHPEQDRALSLREGAILQTFPKKYKFVDPKIPFSWKRIGTHIGNAVPVKLGMVIGKSIVKHIEELGNG